MRIYVCDKTFKGFLSAAVLALKTPAGSSAIISEPGIEPDLFTEIIRPGTDPAAAAGLLRLIDERGSADSGYTVRLAFLSEAPGCETAILEYLRLLLDKGRRADDMLADDRVKTVHGLARKTGGEAHRFKGFTRFKELSDKTLYARIEPGHNILPLLTPHFKARLGPFNWVIHDAGRNTAALHFNGNLVYAPISPERALELDGNEDAVQKLWKHFFKTIAIKERLNPELQRQFVPLKYRKNLTEFEI